MNDITHEFSNNHFILSREWKYFHTSQQFSSAYKLKAKLLFTGIYTPMTRACTNMYTHTHQVVHIHAHVHTLMCMHIYMYTHTHIHTRIHICTVQFNLNLNKHVCTSTCILEMTCFSFHLCKWVCTWDWWHRNSRAEHSCMH